MSTEIQDNKDATEASSLSELLDCEPAPEREAKTPSQRIGAVLESLTLEIQASVHSHARRALLQAFSDAQAVQRERDVQAMTRITIERNALNDANAIMREALERIWRGSDTTLGASPESDAAKYQKIAHDALGAAAKAI